MSRTPRNLDFVQMRVQEADHTWLFKQKRGTAEQLDSVLHRVLCEFRESDSGINWELYKNQVETTKSWMRKYYELKDQLNSRNHVLDEVLEE
jgi:hypothetical protein